MKIFIGGSKTVKSLNQKSIYLLDKICSNDYHVLIGDCFGADYLVQKYLYEHGYTNVTVYASGNKVRNNYGNFLVRKIYVPLGVTGFEFYRHKDIAMANDCDCGLMLWDGKSRGTLYNINDLKVQEKQVEVLIYEQI